MEAVVTNLGTTSVTSAHRFRRAGGELLLDAEIRHVFVDRETAVKAPMPEWARAGLEPWYLPEGARAGRG